MLALLSERSLCFHLAAQKPTFFTKRKKLCNDDNFEAVYDGRNAVIKHYQKTTSSSTEHSISLFFSYPFGQVV